MFCVIALLSLAADLGLADSTIAGLIGHKQQSMTSRYLHLDKVLVSAANTVASETMRLMQRDEARGQCRDKALEGAVTLPG